METTVNTTLVSSRVVDLKKLDVYLKKWYPPHAIWI